MNVPLLRAELIVSTVEMPTLAPMFRIRLKRLVALPMRSLGIGSLVTVVSGTNTSPKSGALQHQGPPEIPEADIQTELREDVHGERRRQNARAQQLSRIHFARSRKPTIGMARNDAIPLGRLVIPAWVAV